MKRFFWAAVAATVVLGAAPNMGQAQFAGGPGIPAVPQPVVPGAVAPAGLGAPGPRVGLFKRMKLGMGECVQKLLQTPFGQLLNNATKPLSALTGGVIPTLEGKPSVDDTKQPGVGGAAAQGKKDAAEAAKRRADVKYLGTLDCRYYPEASKGLADALRTDPSECVRYEAALALTRGCCCTQATIKALTASVSGYEEDGNPGERSARVRCTAAVALERCLACYVQSGGGADALLPDPDCPKKKKEVTQGEQKGEQGRTGEGGGTDERKDDKKPDGAQTPTAKQVERAKEVLAAFVDAYSTTEAMHGSRSASGSRAQPGILEASATQAKATAPAVSTAAYATRTPAPAPAPVVPPSRTAPALAAKPSDWAPAAAPAPTVSRVKFKTEPEAPAVPGPVVPAVEPTTVTAEATTPAVAPLADEADAKAVEQLVHKVLLGETTADQHTAIRQLVKHDWTAHPLVASCLVAGAKSTADAAVRVDCIRHMAHHQMAHKDVLAALADLSADADTWVREEATKAAEMLKK